MPQVSVILPTYNRSATLRRAVCSVLGQSVSDIELIVVDDGSTDDSLDILSNINDPRVSVVQTPGRVGAGRARNLGASLASSPLLAFQDSDDVWLVNRLERQIEHMENTNVEFVCSGYLIAGNDGNYSYQAAQEWMLSGRWEAQYLYQFNFITPTWLINRSLFEKLGGFDSNIPNLEDWELALRAFEVNPIAVINEPLVLKYGGDDSLNFHLPSRARSLEYIIEKHSARFSDCKRVLSRLHSELGSVYIHSDDAVSARHSFYRAILCSPLGLENWLKFFVSIGGSRFYKLLSARSPG